MFKHIIRETWVANVVMIGTSMRSRDLHDRGWHDAVVRARTFLASLGLASCPYEILWTPWNAMQALMTGGNAQFWPWHRT